MGHDIGRILLTFIIAPSTRTSNLKTTATSFKLKQKYTETKIAISVFDTLIFANSKKFYRKKIIKPNSKRKLRNEPENLYPK